MRPTSTTITTQRHRAGRRRGARRLAGGLLAVLALAGCEGVPAVATFEPTTDAERLFLSLTLNHRAVNLSTAAPYDTLQLVATPRDGRGEPMAGLPEPTFLSGDTTRVWVTPDGRLEARQAGTAVQVVAEILTEGNIREADTALVNVTTDADPPELVTFSVPPETWALEAGTSGVPTLALFFGVENDLFVRQLSPRALDDSGSPIPGLQIEYRSLDPEIATIGRWGQTMDAKMPGEARMVARTFAYGTQKADTATVTVVLPVAHRVDIQDDRNGALTLEPTEVTILTNGYVVWSSTTETPVDITFEDPTDVAAVPEACARFGGEFCDAGDIAAFDGPLDLADLAAGKFDELPWRARRFPVPGVYEYESPLTGLTGRVVVVADSTS